MWWRPTTCPVCLVARSLLFGCFVVATIFTISRCAPFSVEGGGLTVNQKSPKVEPAAPVTSPVDRGS